MVKLSIIILTYNSSKFINDCVTSIFSFYSREIEKGEFELIVVDNASTDDTIYILKNLKEKYQEINVFRNERNLGFAKGINKIALNAHGTLVIFLNPDTIVNDRNFIRMANLIVENEKIGVLGGQILNKSGVKELSAGKFYNLINVLFLSLGLENFAKIRFSPSKQEYVDFVSGGFMMVRRDLFMKMGGFDENFFMYVEDMEFCYRIKTKGYKVVFYPYARIKHNAHGSSSRSFAVTNIYKGMLFFYKKHKSKYSYFVVKSLLEAKASVAIFIGIITHNSYLKETYKKALKF